MRTAGSRISAGVACAHEMLDAGHEEAGACVRVDAIEDGEERARREVEQLGGAVGRPHQRVDAAGGLDAAARVERAGLVETGPSEIGGAVDVTGETGGIRGGEQERDVVDAGDGIARRAPRPTRRARARRRRTRLRTRS